MTISRILNYSTGFFLLLLVASYYLAPDLRVSYFPSYLIGIIGLVLALSGQFNRLISQTPFLSSLLVVLVATAGISSLVGDDAQAGLLIGGYGLLILAFVYTIAYITLKLPWFTYAILGTVIVSACVSSVFSIYFFFNLDYQPLTERRLFALGGLSNPVISALSYGAALTVCMSQLALSRERGLSFFLGIMAIILLFAIGLTGTRGVWIGLLVATCTLLFVLPMSRKRRALSFAVFFAVCILTSAIGYFAGFSDLVMNRAMSFRPEIWSETLSQWMSGNLLLGAGMQAAIDLNIPPHEFAHPHSLYISTLYYGGLIGFVLLAALICRLIWVLLNKASPASKIQALPLLVFGLTTLLFDGNRLIEKVDILWLCFWLPVALTLQADAAYEARQVTEST